MPLDTGVFDKIKTFQDYQKADQEFQLKKALAAQTIGTGELENQAKKLSLVGQIVGNNSIDQSSYDRSRQVAADQGLDVSALPDEFNPDVVNRLRFAGATPTAQLTAMIASQGHALRAGIATGDVDAYGYGNAPTTAPTAQAPAKPTQPMTTDNAKKVIDVFGGDDAPAKPVVLSSDNPPAAPAANAGFTFRAQKPGETIDAYKNAQQQGFEAYKSTPAVITTQKKAEKQGELDATNAENARHSTEMTQRLNQNLDALEKLVPDMPDSSYLPPDWKATFDKRNPLSDHKSANAYSQFQEINQQQMINGLSELVKSGQIRGNQFIEKIISRGYMINPDDPKEAQLADIKNLKAELANINTSAQNIAGNSQPYQPIPVTTAMPSTPDAPKIGTTMQGTDGTYLFNGGNPADPKSWKKVK
jgi:hypothetical protein